MGVVELKGPGLYHIGKAIRKAGEKRWEGNLKKDKEAMCLFILFLVSQRYPGKGLTQRKGGGKTQ